ncbi:hypothetical protein GWI33_006930 [Rhynchophorus ferrugineus]|uniref:Transposase n=1 Tax=Rhynchophorus ferrugineus TaxID=354439 RepID=A0A834IBG2_RHYFE|nr:hypothetical protein GWI33_006930 [Rhynchophorus ferrugineus]
MEWYSCWKHHWSLFFFGNDQGVAVTITAERYQDMIRNFLAHEMEEQGLEDMRFQQDGATAHIARSTIQLLSDVFSRTSGVAGCHALKRVQSCIANRGHHLADIIFQS